MTTKTTIGLSAAAGLALGAGQASAQFTTVLNITGPDETFLNNVGPDTQVNIFDGGRVSIAGGIEGPNTEISVTDRSVFAHLVQGPGVAIRLLPGSTAQLGRLTDATLDADGAFLYGGLVLEDGAVANLRQGTRRGGPGRIVVDGGTLNVLGADIGGGSASDTSVELTRGTLRVESGSVHNALRRPGGTSIASLNETLLDLQGGAVSLADRSFVERAVITRGWLEGALWANVVEMSGGTAEFIRTENLRLSGGRLAALDLGGGAESERLITGADFELNGDPIAGQSPLLAPGDVLAGVLADGSVFIFPQDREFINIFGAITLEPASPPPADPMPQDLPVGGLRPGQSLTLGPGQTTPDDYRVLRGSLTIDGGSTGDDLMLIGDLTLLSGETGRWLSVCAGSTVRIDGGALGFGFDVADSVLISSGSDGGGASVRGNSTATFSGGKLFERAEYAETVPVRLIGGEFFVDGVPATDGPRTFDRQTRIVATLEDGTVVTTIARGIIDPAGSIVDMVGSPAQIEFISAELPNSSANPAVIETGVASEKGLRPGESLVVRGDAVLPEAFVASEASLTIESGTIRGNQTATRSIVAITGGASDDGELTLVDSQAQITGGDHADLFVAIERSQAELRDVSLRGLAIDAGSQVTTSNLRAEIALTSAARFDLENGIVAGFTRIIGDAESRIRDAQIEQLRVEDRASVEFLSGTFGPTLLDSEGRQVVRGGTFEEIEVRRAGQGTDRNVTALIEGSPQIGRLRSEAEALTTIAGGLIQSYTLGGAGVFEFLVRQATLDGEPLDPPLAFGESRLFTADQRNIRLAGTLRDGDPFEIRFITDFFGGDFVSPFTTGGVRITRVPGPCNDADLVFPFGRLTQLDAAEFVTLFFADDPAVAAFAEPTDIVNQADVDAFVALFFQGCPS
ncbi:MAG: hypothetical protein AAFR38_04210 [Planctomycetota bacterium]